MKSRPITLLAFLVALAPAWAGFSVPKTVHRIGDLDKAKAEAKAQNKPITILYSDEGTT